MVGAGSGVSAWLSREGMGGLDESGMTTEYRCNGSGVVNEPPPATWEQAGGPGGPPALQHLRSDLYSRPILELMPSFAIRPCT